MPAQIRLISDPRVTAWKAVAAILRADPLLRRVSPDWRLPDSPAWNDDPAADRVTIRLVPKLGAVEEIAVDYPRRVVEGRVDLGVELTMPRGLDAESSQNVWGAIESAVRKRLATPSTDPAQPADIIAHLEALSAAGVFDIDAIAPADAPGDGETGVGNIPITCMWDE